MWWRPPWRAAADLPGGGANDTADQQGSLQIRQVALGQHGQRRRAEKVCLSQRIRRFYPLTGAAGIGDICSCSVPAPARHSEKQTSLNPVALTGGFSLGLKRPADGLRIKVQLLGDYCVLG
jgi:hypothetical protein